MLNVIARRRVALEAGVRLTDVSTCSDQSSIICTVLLTGWKAGITLKFLPHEKSARGEIITDLICLPLIEISLAP